MTREIKVSHFFKAAEPRALIYFNRKGNCETIPTHSSNKCAREIEWKRCETFTRPAMSTFNTQPICNLVDIINKKLTLLEAIFAIMRHFRLNRILKDIVIISSSRELTLRYDVIWNRRDNAEMLNIKYHVPVDCEHYFEENLSAISIKNRSILYTFPWCCEERRKRKGDIRSKATLSIMMMFFSFFLNDEKKVSNSPRS